MHEVNSAYLPETWAYYGVGTTILLLRWAVRLKTVGFRGLQGDDYFSALVQIFFTLDSVLVHVIYYAGTNVEILPSEVASLTPDQIAMLEFGGKCELAAWYSYTALLWCMKGTMLCFFRRLTFGLWQNKMIKYLAIACVLSYLAVMLTVTFGCFPVSNNWRVLPLPDLSCGLKKQNFIVTTVFNVLTDAAILSIPLPLLWKLKVPLRRKIIIALLLCSGVFVITAAIIRVAFSLGSSPSSILVNEWGVRETLVGVISINVPILRPIFNRSFWTTNHTDVAELERERSAASGAGGTFEMKGSGTGAPASGSRNTDGHGLRDKGAAWGKENESEESIVKDVEPVSPTRVKGDVVVSTTFGIVTEDIAEEERGVFWDYGVPGGSSAVVRSGDEKV